jgi:hypothetical protein
MPAPRRGGDIPEGLLNPYASDEPGPAVRGVALGHMGRAVAGVLAVSIPVGASVGQADGPVMEAVVGSGQDVQNAIDAHLEPGAYLWPSPPRIAREGMSHPDGV